MYVTQDIISNKNRYTYLKIMYFTRCLEQNHCVSKNSVCVSKVSNVSKIMSELLVQCICSKYSFYAYPNVSKVKVCAHLKNVSKKEHAYLKIISKHI